MKLEEKIDVCIVTTEEARNYQNVMRNVPVSNLIVERSQPLGLARMRAIQKVKKGYPNFPNTVKLLIEPHGALLEGVNDCSFKNRV